MTRLTCHRFTGAEDARAAEIPHRERPSWLSSRGWLRVGRDTWGRTGSPVTYSLAAAVREQLREDGP